MQKNPQKTDGECLSFSEKRISQQHPLSNPLNCHRNYKRSKACKPHASVHAVGGDLEARKNRLTNACRIDRAGARMASIFDYQVAA